MEKYDIAIVGTGAAGLTAAIYSCRYKMKTVVCGELAGGTATLAHKIENYPGIPSISGVELMQNMQKQVESFGATIVNSKVSGVKKADKEFVVKCENGQEFEAATVVLATGSTRRKMNIPGEKEFLGKGVSYCVTCDGPFFKNKEVAVIGGGDAGVTGALMLSEYAKKIYIIHRGDQFKAEPTWVEKMKERENIETIMNTNTLSFEGDVKLQYIKIDKPHNGSDQIKVDGAFIEIGSIPSTELAKKMGVKINERGRIIVDEKQMTSISNVFAAGDVTDNSSEFDQITTALAEGSIAAFSAYKRVNDSK